MFTRTSIVAASLALLASGPLHAGQGPEGTTQAASQTSAIAHAVANPARTDADRARDDARHPAEVLAFLGVAPGMTVVENQPGAGWYTRILGPLLRDEGTFLAAQADPELFLDSVPEANRQRFRDTVATWLRDFTGTNAELAGPQTRAFLYGVAPDHPAYLPSASVDMVLDIRSIHNLIGAGPERTHLILSEFHRVLKPGGVLGVIDHSEDEASPRTPEESGNLGYVKESVMIALMQKAGFKLVSRSDILANPRDHRDHEGGVWALPPTYANGDKDRAKYTAIGESNRMLLKFVKQ